MKDSLVDALPQADSQVGFDWNAWVGVPYASVGNCWEFIRPIVRAGLGAELPPFCDDHVQELREEFWALPGWRAVTSEPEPFDIVVFTLSPNRAPHVGLVVSVGQFIHCPRGTQSGVDSYHRKFWRERMLEIYRYT